MGTKNGNNSEIIQARISDPCDYCVWLTNFWDLFFKSTEEFNIKPQNIALYCTEDDLVGCIITKNIVSNEILVPLTVLTTPNIPLYVNDQSLIILCSSNGIDQEILEVLEELTLRRATIICITSKGPVYKRTQELNIPTLTIPKKYCQIAQKGYLFIPILVILVKANFIKDINKDFQLFIKGLNQYVRRFGGKINNQAKYLAEEIKNKHVLLIGSSSITESVVNYWNQTLQGILGWDKVQFDVMPDFHRGEFPSYVTHFRENLIILFIFGKKEHVLLMKKVKQIKEELRNMQIAHIDVQPLGDSILENTFSFLVLCDFLEEYVKNYKNDIFS